MEIEDIFRAVTLITGGVTVGYLVGFLIAYVRRVLPLRRKVTHVLVAPPIGWVLAYHVLFLALVATVLLATLQRLAIDDGPVVITFTSPLLMVGVLVVVRRFYVYYVRDLKDWVARGSIRL